jgi:hypothetical protein
MATVFSSLSKPNEPKPHGSDGPRLQAAHPGDGASCRRGVRQRPRVSGKAPTLIAVSAKRRSVRLENRSIPFRDEPIVP